MSALTTEQITNYLSHHWVSGIIDPETQERICYCRDCGCENVGDPIEFNITYPNCNDVPID